MWSISVIPALGKWRTESEIQDHLCLHGKFKAALRYWGPFKSLKLEGKLWGREGQKGI